MDTISSENNNSLLPMIATILGGLAVLLSAIALFKLSSVGKQLANAEGVNTRIEAVEKQVADAANLRNYVAQMERQISQNFANARNEITSIRAELNSIRTELNTLKEATTRRPVQQQNTGTAQAGGQGQQQQQSTPPVAGPDEYVVQAGDNGMKIARSNGVSLNDLLAVNPGVNWNRLRVGQKVKIPKK
jgi:LysM repeat protein